MDTFLAMPPAPFVSKTNVLGMKQGASGLWVATSVQLITEDTDLMAYLAATIKVQTITFIAEPRLANCIGNSFIIASYVAPLAQYLGLAVADLLCKAVCFITYMSGLCL
jgi:hypothetical protein